LFEHGTFVHRPAQTALVAPSPRTSITITPDTIVVTSPALETASATEPAVVNETEPRPALRQEIPERVLKSFERWNDPIETQEKSAPATAPTQATTQRSSDHQLIDLLEKALDRAVEQPRERRRLQFPRQVVAHPKVRLLHSALQHDGEEPNADTTRALGKIHADDF
jgi:hypothetical protein